MDTSSTPKLFRQITIVFTTNSFESSRLALDCSIGFAEHYKAKIVMAHAIELTQPARETEMLRHKKPVLRISAEERLETSAQAVRRWGLEVVIHTEGGEPSDVQLGVAEAYRADTMVLGTHSVHRGLGHVLLGPNVEKLLMKSPPAQGDHSSAGW